LTHHFALIQIKVLKTMREMVIEGNKVVIYGPNSSGKSTVIHFPPLALTEFSAGQYYNSDVLSGLTLERAKAVVKFRELQVEIGGYNLSARRDDGS
jgi:ABC-type polar amino acid transport system ATPase subunit